MIMGHDCTRRCHFCAVGTAKPEPLEADEPRRLAEATVEMDLNHVVVTAVARDDLPDEGAGHFAECVRELRARARNTTIEVLPADFHARRECIAELVSARPDIYNHNIETVERLTPVVRAQAKYERSLCVLEIIKELSPDMPTKSGIMVGLGESFDELVATFGDLQAVGCDILTIGQYLQPTRTDHAEVEKFYTPAEFDALAESARDAGFKHVASGPFVRSSYNAGDVFAELRDRPDAHDARG
jgi:lipoic acid synthetase